MPNCDWGRPCDCRDCRTIYEKIKCSNCGFENTVSIERDSKETYDNKMGIREYDFMIPTYPIKDLICFKYGFINKQVGYYTEIEKRFCENNLKKEESIKEGKLCSKCGKVEGFDRTRYYIEIELTEKNGLKLCQDCLAQLVKEETPDPSNENEKYYLDERYGKWVLNKVRVQCIDCGKKRWVNAENKWKVRCTNCYKLYHSNK